MWPLLLKFIAGGSAVTGITWLAQRWGGRVGGYLAGFPAVFLTALAMTAWGRSALTARHILDTMVVASLGALAADLVIAWMAPRIIGRWSLAIGLTTLFTLWATLAGTSLWLNAR